MEGKAVILTLNCRKNLRNAFRPGDFDVNRAQIGGEISRFLEKTKMLYFFELGRWGDEFDVEVPRLVHFFTGPAEQKPCHPSARIVHFPKALLEW